MKTGCRKSTVNVQIEAQPSNTQVITVPERLCTSRHQAVVNKCRAEDINSAHHVQHKISSQVEGCSFCRTARYVIYSFNV